MHSCKIILVIVLILHGSSASILSKPLDIVNSISNEVSSSVSSTVNKIRNSLKNTEDALLNLTGQVLDLPWADEIITTTFNLINVVIEKGKLDLNNLFQNLNLTNEKYSEILGLKNITLPEGVLDFTSLTEKIEDYSNLAEFLNAITAGNLEDGLDFIGLTQKYIGTAEKYDVITEDGYNLTVFRIPSKTNSGEVVLLSHGVLSSSDDFLLRGNTSLVYMLVQKGYDVWVMNYRGNRYSRRHIELDPDTDAKFWEYSMHEYGYYDLAAVVDYALNVTKQEQLSVIGHSEGTSAVFILTSTKPEYNAKIKAFAALSPVVYLSDCGLVPTLGIRSGPAINEIFLAFGVEELLGYHSLQRKFLQLICSQGSVGYDLCLKVGISALSGYNPDNMEPEFFQTFLAHSPSGTSRKNLMHFVQVGNHDRFAQYDYGPQNEDVYGTVIAPEYDLTKVTLNVNLFVGKNDLILGIEAAERLLEKLSNVGEYVIVDNDLFTHLDFIFGRDAHKVLYPQVILSIS